MTNRVYTVSLTDLSVSTIKTLIQITAGATVPLEIVRITLMAYTSTTLTQIPVKLLRKSVAATMTSTYTAKKNGPSDDPAASALCEINATVEGTDSDLLRQGVFNVLNEWWLLPAEDERPFVEPTTIIGFKLPVAPSPAIELSCDIIFKEKP